MTKMRHSLEPPYNHFNEVPERFGFLQRKEIRNKDNPDLVLLLVGFGAKIQSLRLQYDRYIAGDPEVERMFYDAVPEKDVHATIHRIDLLTNVEKRQLDTLVDSLENNFADFEVPNLKYGERWKVGDGLLSEITADRGDPVRLMRAIANQALSTADLPGCTGDFTSHSTDRYAKELQTSRRSEIHHFLQQADIDPVEFQVPGIYVAVNWPDRNDPINYGTYPYEVIDFIPFAGVDKKTGLSVVYNKLVRIGTQ